MVGLPYIHNKKRPCATYLCKRGSQREDITSYNFINKKKQINADVCGPMTETSVGGAHYYVCFKDDYSKFRRVFFITTKGEMADCLQKFLKEVKTAGHVTNVLLLDGSSVTLPHGQ
jgi:hypothetical protein